MIWFTDQVLASGIWNESKLSALLEKPVALVGATEMKVELGAPLEEPVVLVGSHLQYLHEKVNGAKGPYTGKPVAPVGATSTRESLSHL